MIGSRVGRFGPDFPKNVDGDPESVCAVARTASPVDISAAAVSKQRVRDIGRAFRLVKAVLSFRNGDATVKPNVVTMRQACGRRLAVAPPTSR